jgi:TRAP-type C4-dicarboxylate transport system substrate-binding protein
MKTERFVVKSKYSKRARHTGIASMAIAVLALSACSGGGGSAGGSSGGTLEDMDPITLVYADLGTEAGTGRPFYAWADEIEEKTDGKITFEPYFASTLVPPTETLSAAQNGTADVAFVLADAVASDLPVISWMAKMGSLSSSTRPLATIQGAAAPTDFAMTNPEASAQFSDAGVKLLWAQLVDSRNGLLCVDPVTSLEDAKGKRVISYAFSESELIELGMTPVNLPTTEWYEALQRGVADCLSATEAGAIDYGILEVAKHWTYSQTVGNIGAYMVVNEDVFNSLPLEAQQIIWDAVPTWMSERVSDVLDRYEWLATEGVEEFDVEFHEPDAEFLEKANAFHAAELERVASEAPDEVADGEAFVESFRDTWTTWESRIAEETGLPTEGGSSFDAEATVDTEMTRTLLNDYIYEPNRP